MSQKITCKWFQMDKTKKISKFSDDFIKNYDEDGNIGYFLEVIRKNYSLFTKIYHFYLKVKK